MPTFEGELLSFDAKYRTGTKKGVQVMSKSGMASLNRVIPAPIGEGLARRVQDMAATAFQTLGAHGVARVDFLLDGDGQTVYVNEINTLPGSLAFYLWEASGVPFDKLVTLLVESALERHRRRGETKFSLEANLLQSRPA
jgi:D-alanine-D-alanine ligase